MDKDSAELSGSSPSETTTAADKCGCLCVECRSKLDELARSVKILTENSSAVMSLKRKHNESCANTVETTTAPNSPPSTPAVVLPGASASMSMSVARGRPALKRRFFLQMASHRIPLADMKISRYRQSPVENAMHGPVALFFRHHESYIDTRFTRCCIQSGLIDRLERYLKDGNVNVATECIDNLQREYLPYMTIVTNSSSSTHASEIPMTSHVRERHEHAVREGMLRYLVRLYRSVSEVQALYTSLLELLELCRLCLAYMQMYPAEARLVRSEYDVLQFCIHIFIDETSLIRSIATILVTESSPAPPISDPVDKIDMTAVITNLALLNKLHGLIGPIHERLRLCCPATSIQPLVLVRKDDVYTSIVAAVRNQLKRELHGMLFDERLIPTDLLVAYVLSTMYKKPSSTLIGMPFVKALMTTMIEDMVRLVPCASELHANIDRPQLVDYIASTEHLENTCLLSHLSDGVTQWLALPPPLKHQYVASRLSELRKLPIPTSVTSDASATVSSVPPSTPEPKRRKQHQSNLKDMMTHLSLPAGKHQPQVHSSSYSSSQSNDVQLQVTSDMPAKLRQFIIDEIYPRYVTCSAPSSDDVGNDHVAFHISITEAFVSCKLPAFIRSLLQQMNLILPLSTEAQVIPPLQLKDLSTMVAETSSAPIAIDLFDFSGFE